MAEVLDQRRGGPALSGVRARLLAWRTRALGLPAVGRSIQTIVTVASGLRTEPITLRAAALTYLTVLSVVPLLTVVLSITQVVLGPHGLETRLRDFLVQNLTGGAQAVVGQYISQYVQRASKIGGVGFAFLIFSSISLMMNIEAAFNHTFRATRSRPLLLRLGIYWCFLTLAPLVLAASLAATGYLQAARTQALQHLFVLGPLLLTYLTFWLLYLVVPNTRVRVRPALIGALIAGTAWEIAKTGYAATSAVSVRQSAMYGSLSAIPIFLVWTYLSWIIVLFGARVAYAAQVSHPDGRAQPLKSPRDRELLAAVVMQKVASAFARNAAPPTADDLVRALPALVEDVDETLSRLQQAGLLHGVENNGWVPARPLATIRLADIREAARSSARVPPIHLDGLAEQWHRADSAADAELSTTLEETLGAHRRAD
jgi:membrane protein